MANILLKRSADDPKRPIPNSLEFGELTVNYGANEPGVYFRTANDNLSKVGSCFVGAAAPNSSPTLGGLTGNTVGEFWLDTSSSIPSLKVWTGSVWLPIGEGNFASNLIVGTTSPGNRLDGNPLQDGDLWWNNVTFILYIRIGLNWINTFERLVSKTSTGGSAVMPAGTTAQRDLAPSAGFMRFNVDASRMEFYDGTTWQTL